MSIILKGIDLPRDGRVNRIGLCFLNGDDILYKGLLDLDRAIQIPKGHGRLIDGDEIQAILIEEAYSGEYIERFPLGSTIKWTPTEAQRIINDNAPTILEAEETNGTYIKRGHLEKVYIRNRRHSRLGRYRQNTKFYAHHRGTERGVLDKTH